MRAGMCVSAPVSVCVRACVCVCERERQTDTDRQTDRQNLSVRACVHWCVICHYTYCVTTHTRTLALARVCVCV